MAPSLDEILALEAAVWQALCDGDVAGDEELLADDFVGVYPTGIAGRGDHSGQLDDGATVEAFRIDAPQLLVVGPDAALLIYDATYRRPGGTEERMYVSSLWMRREGIWRNVFSQDTPPGPAVP